MGKEPILVAPFDAELFGHWWFEGPAFLSELFNQSKEKKVQFTTLKDILIKSNKLQLCDPCPSSWGKGGYHDYWINETNAWIIHEWSKASQAMCNISSRKVTSETELSMIKQAAKELLLAQ